MKCPKCGYHSFDYLDSCKKCGQVLAEHKEKYNLRGFISPGTLVAGVTEPVIDDSYEEEDATEEGSIDFGFDFLDDEARVGEPAKTREDVDDLSLGKEKRSVNINQPFAADSETVPADSLETDSETEAGDKPEKGPEFAF